MEQHPLPFHRPPPPQIQHDRPQQQWIHDHHHQHPTHHHLQGPLQQHNHHHQQHHHIHHHEQEKISLQTPPNHITSPSAPPPTSAPHAQDDSQPQTQPTSKKRPPNRPVRQNSSLPPPPFPIGETIDGGRIRLLDFVGQGSFAHVYLAFDSVSQTNCAVKCVRKQGLDVSKLNTQRREAQALEALNGHPNVVKLLRVVDDDEEWLLIVMEFCELDLFEAVMQNGGFPEHIVRSMFGQLCEGLAHCHSRGYYHRDIKPENCLVDLATMTIKLTDFGLVTRDTWSREMGCGSARYLAPEACASADGARGYSAAASDIWALSVILLNLLFSKNPWYEATPTDPIFSQFIGSNPDILRSQFNLSPEFFAVLRRAFSLDPAMRLPLAELKRQVLNLPRFVATPASIPQSLPSPSTTPQDYKSSSFEEESAAKLLLDSPDRGKWINDNGNPFRSPGVTPFGNAHLSTPSPRAALVAAQEPSNLDIIVEANPFDSPAQPMNTILPAIDTISPTSPTSLTSPISQTNPQPPLDPLDLWPQPSRQTPLVPVNLALGREGIGRLEISRLTHSQTAPRSRKSRHYTRHQGSNAFSVAAAALHPLANAIAGWSIWATAGWGATEPVGAMVAEEEEAIESSKPLLLDGKETGEGMGEEEYSSGSEVSSDGDDRVPDEEDPYEPVRHDRRRVLDLETGGAATKTKHGLKRVAGRSNEGALGYSGGKFAFLQDKSPRHGVQPNKQQGNTASSSSSGYVEEMGRLPTRSSDTSPSRQRQDVGVGYRAGALASKSIKLGVGDAGMIQVDSGWQGSRPSKDQAPQPEALQRDNDDAQRQRQQTVERLMADATAAATATAAQFVEMDERSKVNDQMRSEKRSFSPHPISINARILITPATEMTNQGSSSSSSSESSSSIASSVSSPIHSATLAPSRSPTQNPFSQTTRIRDGSSGGDSGPPSSSLSRVPYSQTTPSGREVQPRRPKSEPPTETRLPLNDVDKGLSSHHDYAGSLFRFPRVRPDQPAKNAWEPSRGPKKSVSNDDLNLSPSIHDFEAMSGLPHDNFKPQRSNPLTETDQTSTRPAFGFRAGFAQIYDASLGLLVGQRRRGRKKQRNRDGDDTDDSFEASRDVEDGRESFEMPVSREVKAHPHRHRHKDVPERRVSTVVNGDTLLPPPTVPIAVVAAAIRGESDGDFEKMVARSGDATERREERGRHRFRRNPFDGKEKNVKEEKEEKRMEALEDVAVKDSLPGHFPASAGNVHRAEEKKMLQPPPSSKLPVGPTESKDLSYNPFRDHRSLSRSARKYAIEDTTTKPSDFSSSVSTTSPVSAFSILPRKRDTVTSIDEYKKDGDVSDYDLLDERVDDCNDGIVVGGSVSSNSYDSGRVTSSPFSGGSLDRTKTVEQDEVVDVARNGSNRRRYPTAGYVKQLRHEGYDDDDADDGSVRSLPVVGGAKTLVRGAFEAFRSFLGPTGKNSNL